MKTLMAAFFVAAALGSCVALSSLISYQLGYVRGVRAASVVELGPVVGQRQSCDVGSTGPPCVLEYNGQNWVRLPSAAPERRRRPRPTPTPCAATPCESAVAWR